jgi:hypothetical protein
MVFDWGYGRPWAALWFAIDYDKNMYLYRAYYGMRKNESGQYDPNKGARQTNIEICRKIRELEKEKISFRVADPACWGPTKIGGKNTVLGPSFVEDAGKEGLYFLAADNDRLRGKQQVHMRLKIEEETDSDGEVTSEGVKFYAFKTDENNERGVKRWWEEMMSLYEDPKNPEDIDTDQPDEGYDCFRYACMSRPVAPKKRSTVPPGSFTAERNRLIKARKYSRKHGVSLTVAYSRVR